MSCTILSSFFGNALTALALGATVTAERNHCPHGVASG